MTLKKVFTFLTLGLVLFCVAATVSPLFAQEVPAVAEPVIAPSSFWYDIWTIIQPVAVLLVTTVSPIIVGWLSLQLSRLLQTQDEKKKLEVEEQLRRALHDSAMNALKYAATKFGVPNLSGPLPQTVGKEVIAAAVEYVRDKNPETVAKMGVDKIGLEQIIMSKVPDLITATQGSQK